MEIRKITIQEWKKFNDEYPYERFKGTSKFFEEDCVEHCSPNNGMSTIGAFFEKRLIGLVSHNTMYFYTEEETNESGVVFQSRGYNSSPKENSIPIIYVFSMVTHPDFRRKKVLKKMMEYLEDNKTIEEHIVLYPVSEEALQATKKLGFDYHDTIWAKQEDVVKTIVA